MYKLRGAFILYVLEMFTLNLCNSRLCTMFPNNEELGHDNFEIIFRSACSCIVPQNLWPFTCVLISNFPS
jgi:hypothetical protein